MEVAGSNPAPATVNTPVIFQVEIEKVVENDPYNMAMGSQFFSKSIAGFFFHPFSDKS